MPSGGPVRLGRRRMKTNIALRRLRRETMKNRVRERRGQEQALGPAAGLGSRRRCFSRRLKQVEQLHPIIFGPYIAKPMSDIAAQHEGVIGRLALAVLVADESQERNGSQLYLLISHFVEFRDLDDHGILQLLEIRSMGGLIPL